MTQRPRHRFNFPVIRFVWVYVCMCVNFLAHSKTDCQGKWPLHAGSFMQWEREDLNAPLGQSETTVIDFLSLWFDVMVSFIFPLSLLTNVFLTLKLSPKWLWNKLNRVTLILSLLIYKIQKSFHRVTIYCRSSVVKKGFSVKNVHKIILVFCYVEVFQHLKIDTKDRFLNLFVSLISFLPFLQLCCTRLTAPPACCEMQYYRRPVAHCLLHSFQDEHEPREVAAVLDCWLHDFHLFVQINPNPYPNVLTLTNLCLILTLTSIHTSHLNLALHCCSSGRTVSRRNNKSTFVSL